MTYHRRVKGVLLNRLIFEVLAKSATPGLVPLGCSIDIWGSPSAPIAGAVGLSGKMEKPPTR